MKHAREDYNRIQDPENIIPEDEPVFLIRGQDPAAPNAVREYANQAAKQGASDAMIGACIRQATAMEQWQAEHPSTVHTPDMPT